MIDARKHTLDSVKIAVIGQLFNRIKRMLSCVNHNVSSLKRGVFNAIIA